MKNIENILKDCGIAVTEEQLANVNKSVAENYKTIAEVEKKDAKIETLTAKVKETEEALKTFDGIDAEGLKKQIADLTKSLSDKDTEYAQKMADRDFNDVVNRAIADAKGKNAKAIISLLDVDTLKASKNQTEDVAKAIKSLTEAEDSKFLFESAEKVTNPIGTFSSRTHQPTSLDDKYKGNPYYHPTK